MPLELKKIRCFHFIWKKWITKMMHLIPLLYLYYIYPAVPCLNHCLNHCKAGFRLESHEVYLWCKRVTNRMQSATVVSCLTDYWLITRQICLMGLYSHNLTEKRKAEKRKPIRIHGKKQTAKFTAYYYCEFWLASVFPLSAFPSNCESRVP